ncbi:hypothetical protein Thermus77927_24770 [Thermus hydrothermalis]
MGGPSPMQTPSSPGSGKRALGEGAAHPKTRRKAWKMGFSGFFPHHHFSLGIGGTWDRFTEED